jgi:8-oxo-dGTP pyrophosphatase MutT (NUDIX family)
LINLPSFQYFFRIILIKINEITFVTIYIRSGVEDIAYNQSQYTLTIKIKGIDMKWTIRSSNYLVKDRWISLRADECIMPDGKVIAPFYVYEYPDWINVVPLTDANEIILIRQYRHGIQDVILELPSGVVDPDESDPAFTARRELLEETGYESTTIIPLSKLYPNPDKQTNAVYAFLALHAECKHEQSLDDSEQIEVVKVPMSEIHSLLKHNKIPQAMHVAALFHALTYLGEHTGIG